jgi:hypothetical protein
VFTLRDLDNAGWFDPKPDDKTEEQEHEARLLVAINFLDAKKIAHHVKVAAVKDICKKDPLTYKILKYYGAVK